MSDLTLKPCPFCGREARVVEYEGNEGVMLEHCTLTTDPDCHVELLEWFKSRSVAVSAWNHRDPSEYLRGLRDAQEAVQCKRFDDPDIVAIYRRIDALIEEERIEALTKETP